jgi:isoquinoline 1-oxidoreductase subunit beta
MVKVTRRGFMIGGAVAGGTIAGALALGVGFLSTVDTEGLDGKVKGDGTVDLNAWVTIQPDGKIIFYIPRNEMGQGVYTSLPMLIAEELEVDLNDPNVSVAHPTENLAVYANFVLALRKRPEMLSGAGDWIGKKIFGLVPFIATGGSTSIVDAYTPLRRAGAAARGMLVAAAAKRWSVAPADCFAENAHVIHRASGKRLSYGALAAAAAAETPNKTPTLKPASEFRLIGTSQARLDIPSKTRGEAKFGIDTVLDGMLYAAVVQSPVFKGAVRSFDDSNAKKVKGYRKTVNLGDAVAVVAENFYYAKKAAGLLEIDFDDGGNGALTSQHVSEQLAVALERDPGHTFTDDGVDEALAGDDLFEARYEVPYLAHACMEPMNATAVVKDGHAEIWTSTQTPLAMQWAAEQNIDGLKSVTGHVTLSGGGFGRRAEKDAVVHAVKVAVAMPGVPVKTVWTREEDTQHDMYRPAVAATIKAGAFANGIPTALDFKIALQSVGLDYSRRNLPIEQGGSDDRGNVEGVLSMPYAIKKKRVTSAAIELPVPVGNWRSVGHSYNCFFLESFVDELAARAKTDPMAYRFGLLAGHKRLTALAQKLAVAASWGAPVGENEGRGIAIHASFRSFVGQVIDISDHDGLIKIDRVTCVIDCGQTVNPDTVRAQMEGGIIYGLTAAMYGDIVIDEGRVKQGNFPDYPMLHMRQTPEIDVHIIESTELPGGVGEPGTPPAFPALANAYFNLTGKRLRSMPLAKHGVAFL